MPQDEKTRRNYLKNAGAIGTASIIGMSSATAAASTSNPGEYIQKLVDKHGNFKIKRGQIVSKDGEKIADTAGNRLDENGEKITEDNKKQFSQDHDLGSVKLVQPLQFEDGYKTRTETGLELDSSQESAIKSEDSTPSGSAVLINKVESEEFKEEFSFKTIRRKSKKAKEEARDISIEPQSSPPNISPEYINGDTFLTSSDDGTEELDNSLPILNSVGANYKTSDNRCGVAQRSVYLTVNSSATAEVYNTEYVGSDISNATITFSGDILGSISSVGMGGYITAEGFVRDTSTGDEDSTLLMDANVGVVQLPFVWNGNVDAQFGPDDGTVGDQPYLDYELNTDLQSGEAAIGVRMKVVFNGLKGGVTQTNFMPAKQSYQAPNLGTEFYSIEIDT